jgi:prepilin-type processing-associated H-X9-DG protein
MIELLTVIAIIGILASLAIVGIQRARLAANKAQGVQALRSMGIAVALYLTDHKDRLPGPLGTNQYAKKPGDNPAPPKGEASQLLYHLAPCLGADSLPKGSVIESVVPRQFRSKGGNLETQTPYFANPYCLVPGNNPDPAKLTSPWGEAGVDGKDVPNLIPEVESPSRQVAVIDFDSQLPQPWDGSAYGKSAMIMDEPIYGTARNALYFDWHVGSIPVGTNYFAVKRW